MLLKYMCTYNAHVCVCIGFDSWDHIQKIIDDGGGDDDCDHAFYTIRTTQPCKTHHTISSW